MADKHDPHPFHLKAELILDELSEKIDRSDLPEDAAASRQIADLVREAESVLQQGRQLFTTDTYLAASASRLATMLENHPKALQILDSAFKHNQHNAFIAIRLARQYSRRRDSENALIVNRPGICGGSIT